jgi:di/tricarboxylate transporter
MFWIHASSLFINMTITRGDLILNNALLNIANIELLESTWVKYMAVPSLILYIVSAVGFVLMFKKELDKYNHCEKVLKVEKEKLTKKDKINMVIIALVVVIWATESFHGISGTLVVILGSIAMFANKLLKKEDLKCVDVNLLIFLTAAFSIGKVMTYSGTSDVIFSNFVPLFPDSFNNLYILMIVLVSMALHMILGSNVTSLSVVLPGVMLISSGVVDPVIVMFITYVAVCGHFVLPFHSVPLLIGNGNKLFSSRETIKFSPVITVIVLTCIFLVYKTWWSMIGVL